MRARWRRHPRWVVALARRRVRRWASYTFIYRPQVAYAYHVKYRHKTPMQRTLQSAYWPHVRTLRSYSSPLLDLIPFDKRTLDP